MSTYTSSKMTASSSSDTENVVTLFMNAYIVPGAIVGPGFQPCIHTVCRTCLAANNPQEYRRGGKRLKCQTCSFEADYVPDVKCYQRPDDFKIALMHLSIKVFEAKSCCDYNRQVSSSHQFYCRQCEKLLCFYCKGEHFVNRHNVSNSRSHIPKQEFSDTDFCSFHESQLEICCVACKNALCIVCFLEKDETVFNIVNSDYKRVQDEASTLKKGLYEIKQILDTEIQKIHAEPRRIECKIDEQVTQLKNHLEMCSKRLKHRMKAIQEEEKSRLETEVQSVVQTLRVITNFMSFGPGLLRGKDIVRYLSKWTGFDDLQKQCDEILHQCHKKSQLCFEPASNHEPFNEDVIGTLQGIESSSSQEDVGKIDSHTKEFSQDVTKKQNLQQVSLSPANHRSMDAANTFQSVTGTFHKDEDGLIKIQAALNKYFKAATETRQKIEEVISIGSSYKSNDAFAAIRSILNKNCENELQATQSLCDTLASIYKEPTSMSSKCDQLDEFLKILERRNEESKQEASIVLNRNRGQGLQPQLQVSTLANLGNTCFLNVVIQVLCRTNIFVKLLSEGFPTAEENRTVKGDSITALVKLFTLMLSKDGSHYYPTEFYDSLRDKFKKFTDLNQHDSHDLMIHLLNRIRKEEIEALGITSSKHQNNAENVRDCRSVIQRKTLTVVDKVFGGHIFTAYICTECFQPYHLCEPFLALSLPIYERQGNSVLYDTEGYNNLNMGDILQHGTDYQQAVALGLKPFDGSDVIVNGGLENTLISSLEHFTCFEYMKHEYLCKDCNANLKDNVHKMTSVAKRTLIYSPPAILTIHLKRFQQESTGVGFVKNDEHIQFNYHLDIAPFCSSGCLNVDFGVKNIWYMLYGVVVHWGTLRSGHYLIYVMVREDERDMKDFLQKEFLDRDSRFGERELIESMRKINNIGTRHTVKPSAKLGTWYRISDGQCNMVQSYTGTDEILRQKAYMLFYERI